MPLVKTVWVKLQETGAAEVKAALDDVAARARAVGAMDPTIKVAVDKNALASLRAMRLELRALTSSGDQEGLTALAARLKALGEGTDSPKVKMSALSMELRAVEGAAQAAAGAIGPGGAAAAGGGGLLATLGGTGTAAAIAAASATALVSGLGGLIPAAAAAVVGLGAFGALAMPVFTQLKADITAVSTAAGAVARYQAWEAIPKAMWPVVQGGVLLQKVFADFAKQLDPSVLQLFGEGLKIIGTLLPQILPFAQAAATAINGLLQGFDRFAQSAGFADRKSNV